MSNSELTRLRHQAESLALSGDWGKTAIEINTKILENNEHASDAYTRLARCFLTQGNQIAAYEMYKQVLAFDSKNIIARNNLKLIEKDVKRMQEKKDLSAISSYDEAFSIGVAARRRGRFDLAIIALLRAAEIRPDSPFAWNALGAAYRRNGKAEDAYKAFERALAHGGGNVSYVGMAAVKRMMGNSDMAIEIYKKVLSQDKNNVYALNGIAAVYVDIGDLVKGENYFNRASKLSDGKGDAIKGLEALRRTHESNGDQVAVERITRWLDNLCDQS